MPTSIRYTDYGVPHITGDSYFELGRGVGYANAEQHLGILADRWLTLRGRRSEFYGPDALVGHGPNADTTNIESDFFWRYLEESGETRRIFDSPPPLGPSRIVTELFEGFADGYNEYLDKAKEEGIDDPRFDPATWLEPITVDDVFRQSLHWNLIRSSISLIPQIVAGTNPQYQPGGTAAVTGQPAELPEESNMIALGADATESGGGMLYANPHWYWSGPDSFREMHLTIPGVLDVYGSTVPGIPLIMSGFSENLAFAGTSSLSPRFTVYRYELDPEDPTKYRYGHEYRKMTAHTVRCPVLVGGQIEHAEKTFLSTHHGLLLGGEKYPRAGRRVYGMREVGFSIRWTNQQLAVMTASTVSEADERAKAYLGVGWRNFAGADSNGDVVYADRTAIPNLSNEQLARNQDQEVGSAEWDASQAAVLDGSDPANEWLDDEDAPIPGIIGVSRLPVLYRKDYVANENDSHWTNHASVFLEGFPKAVGAERVPRSLRTRSGLNLISKMLKAAQNKVSLRDLRQATTEDVVWSAVLWKDEVCTACVESQDKDLIEAAQVLSRWDSSEKIESRGAILWRRFYFHFAGSDRNTPQRCFSTPFDINDPLGTPAGICRDSGNGIEEAMRAALSDMIGMPLDISVGEAQYIEKRGRRYPVPGGPQEAGQYNVIKSKSGWVPGEGYPHVVYGTGFQLWVSFTSDGPIAESILAYSQSENPASEYFSDQTELFSAGRTKPVRFKQEDIADHTQRKITLRERASVEEVVTFAGQRLDG